MPEPGRLNPNCVFVQRAGHPIYESCEFCSLKLRDCMRFRGQWVTGVAIVFAVVLALAPLSKILSVLLGGGLVVLMGVYFAYVSKQSHRSIVNDFRVRAQQKKLASSERLAALGEISAVVMHEINNPLTYVEANASLVQEAIEELREKVEARAESDAGSTAIFEELNEVVDDLTAGVSKVRMIAEDLKAATRTEGDTNVFSAVRAVNEALDMASSRVGDLARIEFVGPAVSARVCVREGRLVQVLSNLIVNGAQACAEAGRPNPSVTVSLRADEDQRGTPLVIISVQDNGTGVPPELQSRIFEPFFTTKPIGVGTGLGLSICAQMVVEMKGTLSLRETSSMGTLFEVALPASSSASA